MIRCVRMWTGEDGNSHFEEGSLMMKPGEREDEIGAPIPVMSLSFRETEEGGAFAWHTDPVPRFVITLSGTLEFTVASGDSFIIRPGDILLAEDNLGSGHRWRLIDQSPWRRAYVVFDPGADLTFRAQSGVHKSILLSHNSKEV